jgi:outer membrane autotransporter protein
MIEGGYKISLDGDPTNAFVTPFLRLQGSTAMQAPFTETGANSLNLNVASQSTNSLRSVLGAQFGVTIEKVDLRAQLGWSHEFADTSRPVTASFVGAPAIAYALQGAPSPVDGAIVGLMAIAKASDAASLYVRYDGNLDGGTTSHIFSAGLRIVW